MNNDFNREQNGPADQSHAQSPIDPAEVNAQVARVLEDPLFANSRRYSNLLRYIVEHSLRGEQEDLRERIIGMVVYGRPADYDTSIDPTVRVTAGEVRKRLSLYYQGQGREQEIRIEIPLRSYIAEFHRPESTEEPQEQKPTSTSKTAVQRPSGFRWTGWRWTAVACAVVAALLITVVVLHLRSRATKPMDVFWSPFVTPGSQTMIYVGTSSSIEQPKETGSSAQNQVPLYYQFSRQRGNVSMTDVTVAQDLAFYLQSRHGQGWIREANSSTLAELHNKPVILVGIENNWTRRLTEGQRYHFQRDADLGLRWIEDREHPENRQWMLNMSAPYDQVEKDYAIILRTHNSTTGHMLLGVAGLSGMGTMAAHQVMLNEAEMTAFLSHLPKGWENRNLELVLEIHLVQGSPGSCSLVAYSTW